MHILSYTNESEVIIKVAKRNQNVPVIERKAESRKAILNLDEVKDFSAVIYKYIANKQTKILKKCYWNITIHSVTVSISICENSNTNENKTKIKKSPKSFKHFT